MGEAYIRVKSNNYLDAVIKVKVIPKLQVANINVSLKKGETFKIKLTVSPSLDKNDLISYFSDNEEIAKVNSEGIIYGVERGSTTITIKTSNGGIIHLNVLIT